MPHPAGSSLLFCAALASQIFPEHVAGVPAAPAAAYGPLDVRTFGAKGDGVTDDAAAIQSALDAAQRVSALGTSAGPTRPVYFPAGLYLVNRTLTITSTHNKTVNTKGLRLYGDGVGQSAVIAGSPMDAVLRFSGHGPEGGTAGVTTNGHTMENLRFDGAGLANYSVAATAITRSLFRYSDFSGARIAGLFLGYVRLCPAPAAANRLQTASRICSLVCNTATWTVCTMVPSPDCLASSAQGWINDVLECYFTGNLIGLYLDNAVNSVNVVDGNFEDNSGVGIIVNSGAMVRLEGNEFGTQRQQQLVVEKTQ
jgi:hypothetical protein